MFFCREGAWIRTFLPKGASIRNYPYRYTLSQLRKKLRKGTSTRGLHDRNPARAGAAHFAGAPSKLCIYDNSTTMTLPARRLINTTFCTRRTSVDNRLSACVFLTLRLADVFADVVDDDL